MKQKLLLPLLHALSTLTVCPGFKQDMQDHHVKMSTVFFPVAGFCVGTILAAISFVLNFVLYKLPNSVSANTANTFIVLAAFLLMKGFQGKGLAASAGIVFFNKNKTNAPNHAENGLNAAGAVMVFIFTYLKISLLTQLNADLKRPVLFMLPAVSFWCLVMGLSFYPPDKDAPLYARFQPVSRTYFALATLATLLTGFFCFKAKAALLAAGVFIPSLLFLELCRWRLKTMQDHILGAAAEISEVCFLLSAAFTSSI